MALHLELLTRENVESGMAPTEARLAARRALGGMAQIAEQCRDQRRVGWLSDLGKDIAYAWRMLRKSPGFTAVAALTLALGVGGCVAVYALAEALVLRSLPYPAPERLVSISSVHVRRGESGIGQDDFRDWQASSNVFERMTFTEFSQMTLTGQGEPERITGLAVWEGFFETLGVAPRLGRWFNAEEQKPRRGERVVMLSHQLWTRKFGARADVVGTTLIADGVAVRIVGVMPENFHFGGAGGEAWVMGQGYGTEYWTPIRYVNHGRQQHQYSCYARLNAGARVQRAQAELSEISRRLEQQFPDNAGWGVRVVSLRSDLLRGLGSALGVFAAAAAIVLLIACANVASLLLARGAGRAKEIAVRMALGAGRRRVVRLLLVESLLLACLGTAAGLALAYSLIRAAIAAAPRWVALGEIVVVSPTLVAVVIALALGTGALTGLWPALRGSRADPQRDLKEGGAAVVAGVRSLDTLVVVEIGLAVTLLIAAGLLGKSFVHLVNVDPGYRVDHLVTFRLSLPGSRYRDGAAQMQFCDRLLAEVGALRGVASVAASDSVPLGGTFSGGGVQLEGDTVRRSWADASVRFAGVTPDYFRTLGIGLRAGRMFEATDSVKAEPVAMVNETFVRKLMPDRPPIGVRVRLGGDQWRRIVGVVGDSRYQGPAKAVEAEAYTPFAQDPYLGFVVIRTGDSEYGVLPAVRRAIGKLDAQLAMTQVRTMQESMALATSLPRAMMLLAGGFAAIALGMSTLGLGGVMAYTVSRRRREIGLRMALGASGSDVARSVAARAAGLACAGCAMGTAGAMAGARLLASVLHGVEPRDPAVTIAAPVLLVGVALAACVVPARRAASVDPMAALRQE